MPSYPVSGPKEMIDRIVAVVASMEDVTVTRDDPNGARLHWRSADISVADIADRIIREGGEW